MALDWWADSQKVIAKKKLGKEHYLRFVADNIRVERSHPYARVSVLFDNHILDEDDLALDKRESRTRLINSAHRAYMKLPLDIPEYHEATASSDMLTFCRDAYEKWSSSVEVTLTHGIPPTPTPWLAEPFILEDAGTILFAAPGTGKSWFSLLLAVCLDSGKQSIITPTYENINVLYVNLERSEKGLGIRLGMLNDALGLERTRPLRMVHARGKTLTALSTSIRSIIDKEGIDLVILDSLSRSGASLIDDVQVNRTMDTLNSFQCAWFAIGHTARNGGGSNVFGSVMQDAAADAIFRLEGAHDSDVMFQRLTLTKANDFNLKEPIAYRWVMPKTQTDEGWFTDIQGIYHMSPEDFPEAEEVEEKSATTAELSNEQLDYIWNEGSVTPSQFAEYFEKSVSWASRILSSSNHLSSEQEGRNKRYSVRKE